MGLPAHKRLLAVAAAALHDGLQEWERSGEDPVIRKRFVGFNEVGSVSGAVGCMCEVNEVEQTFFPVDVGVVSSAIIATIPDWSVEHRTVIQPFLNPSSHPVVRAVALADVGEAGMDPESFRQAGFKLFAEDQIDIMEALNGANSSDDISDEMWVMWRRRLLAWLKGQPEFARGRLALLDSELEGLDPEAKRRVTDLFCHFDESIAAAEENVRWAEQADFVPLMRKLLPTAFPSDQ